MEIYTVKTVVDGFKTILYSFFFFFSLFELESF